MTENQQPVAWMVYTEGGTSAYVTDNPNDLVGAHRALPLYTSPPQRKPLSNNEALHLAVKTVGLLQSSGPVEGMVGIVRAVEVAHGIKEQS
jgi:hypothetical protein